MTAAPQLTALAEAMRARVRRDECNDPVIAGKRGNVHADGTGFSVAVMLGTPRQWTTAKAKLGRFCQVRQDGDSEGVVFMPGVPDPAGCALLREILGIRPRRLVSETERQRLADLSARYRPSASVNRGSQAAETPVPASGVQTPSPQREERSGAAKGGSL